MPTWMNRKAPAGVQARGCAQDIWLIAQGKKEKEKKMFMIVFFPLLQKEYFLIVNQIQNYRKAHIRISHLQSSYCQKPDDHRERIGTHSLNNIDCNARHFVYKNVSIFHKNGNLYTQFCHPPHLRCTVNIFLPH